MIVYRSQSQRVDARERLDQLQALAAGARSVEATRELLIEAGVLESAVADALHPDCDGETACEAALRAVSTAAAGAFAAAWQGAGGAPAATQLQAALARVDRGALP